ncbi:hypothetical protein [Flectobacillus longus]|uniref:Uncharacterized protein n=1 Tax=Flectobacillus longus TaxID=2984207 RepID=A0ABT6YQC7_9BACT|nr:hypothetical protein [Flectobacillus longus]MDI9865793.1 hypothetical protein [Flectobacillus longus]MDI9882700.1 hypothetical protein [Flectobacillus longus]
MKTSTQNKILLLTLLLGVWVSSSSFGLVEPTTVLENRRHQSEMKADSSQSLEKLKLDQDKDKKDNNSNNSNQDSDDSDKRVTDSLIQWIANSLHVVFINFINALFHLK